MPHGNRRDSAWQEQCQGSRSQHRPQTTGKTETWAPTRRGFESRRGAPPPHARRRFPVRAQGRRPPAEPAGAGGADPGTGLDASPAPARFATDRRPELERAGVPRSTAMDVGHKTESIYRRYAIVDETMLKEGARE